MADACAAAPRCARGDELFGVYIHWPFCASKCPYCDFNSHVREQVDHAAWRDALVREIKFYAQETGPRKATSIFFGGGTPSLMAPETVAAVIDAVNDAWALCAGAEITLEANPTSVEARKFADFRAAGINRVSLGVQSLRDESLKFLGRKHDVAEALQAIDIARRHFDRFSFDLIYARPEQDLVSWEAELNDALKLSAGHLSLYQLTIEQGTAFHTQHARGDFSIPDGDLAGDFYEVTQDILGQARMPAYEISNHAAAGEESLHNLTYWRYGDYAGIGPGAHGRLMLPGRGRIATRAHRAPEKWLEMVAAQQYGAHPFEQVGPAQSLTEALMMGLRLREGVSLSRLSALCDTDWRQMVAPARIEALAGENMLVWDADNEYLRPTIAGMQRLNGILGYLLS